MFLLGLFAPHFRKQTILKEGVRLGHLTNATQIQDLSSDRVDPQASAPRHQRVQHVCQGRWPEMPQLRDADVICISKRHPSSLSIDLAFRVLHSL